MNSKLDYICLNETQQEGLKQLLYKMTDKKPYIHKSQIINDLYELDKKRNFPEITDKELSTYASLSEPTLYRYIIKFNIQLDPNHNPPILKHIEPDDTPVEFYNYVHGYSSIRKSVIKINVSEASENIVCEKLLTVFEQYEDDFVCIPAYKSICVIAKPSCLEKIKQFLDNHI